jgi:hypothetical protein
VGTVNLNQIDGHHNPDLFAAFNAPRTGGESPLFNSIFGGLNFGNGVVENTTLTGQRPFARTPRRERRLRTATLERLSAHLTPPTPAPAQPEQSSGAPVFPENYIIPDPQYASVSLLDNVGDSTYHSLQLQFHETPDERIYEFHHIHLEQGVG